MFDATVGWLRRIVLPLKFGLKCLKRVLDFFVVVVKTSPFFHPGKFDTEDIFPIGKGILGVLLEKNHLPKKVLLYAGHIGYLCFYCIQMRCGGEKGLEAPSSFPIPGRIRRRGEGGFSTFFNCC